MKELKIAVEMAEQEFENWAEAMDIDVDPSRMDADDEAAFDTQKSKIVKAISVGSLVFNDNDEAVYTPQRGASKHKEPITFRERTGASLMAMDGKKKGHDIAKTYAMMAEMCGTHPHTFAGLAGTDIKVCEAIFALLMD